jgi:hypothetical protein
MKINEIEKSIITNDLFLQILIDRNILHSSLAELYKQYAENEAKDSSFKEITRDSISAKIAQLDAIKDKINILVKTGVIHE